MKTKALIFVLSKEYGELTGDDNWISNWEKYMLVRSISSGGAAGEQLVATTRFSCRSWSSCQTHACPSPPPPPPSSPPQLLHCQGHSARSSAARMRCGNTSLLNLLLPLFPPVILSVMLFCTNDILGSSLVLSIQQSQNDER